MPKTIYSLNDVHVQVMYPNRFRIEQVDADKKTCKKDTPSVNYFNLGYFAKTADGSTVPVGNLVIDGKVITDAATQADWLSTYSEDLTTLVIHNNNNMAFYKTADMRSIPAVKYAVSGIPIIRNGYKVSMDDIKLEGYFGDECYNTIHGFLGIRGDQLVYVAANVGFGQMVYLLEVLGIKDAIKLDGGGSFILKNNTSATISTPGNRRINNIGVWW